IRGSKGVFHLRDKIPGPDILFPRAEACGLFGEGLTGLPDQLQTVLSEIIEMRRDGLIDPFCTKRSAGGENGWHSRVETKEPDALFARHLALDDAASNGIPYHTDPVGGEEFLHSIAGNEYPFRLFPQ